MKTTHARAVIDGYTIETADTGEGALGFYVSKGRLAASLACLEDVGALHDGEGIEGPPVPDRTLSRLTAWANARGHSDA